MIEVPKNPRSSLSEDAWRTLMSVSLDEGKSMKAVVSELICSTYPEHVPPPKLVEGQIEMLPENEKDGDER